MAQINEESESL